MTTADLLGAALRRDLRRLSAEAGVSTPRLAQMMLQAISDPQVIAEYPAECRQLAARRDTARAGRRSLVS